MTLTSAVKQRNQHNRLYLIPTIATKQRNLSIAGFFHRDKTNFCQSIAVNKIFSVGSVADINQRLMSLISNIHFYQLSMPEVNDHI